MSEININLDKIEEQDEELTEKKDYSFIGNTNITQYRSDMGFKTLVDGFDQLLFVIPKYQRKFIWSQEQVENLAVSLVRGLPIPPIYVYRNEKNQLEILDGQQRMLSLFLYYKSKYIKNKTNTLVELQELINDVKLNINNVSFEKLLEEKCHLKNAEYKLRYTEKGIEKIVDITYKNLPIEIKRKVDFTVISIIEIKVDSDEQKRNRAFYKVFQNLNSGGTALKNQELRNGVYQCEFYDMLHEINNTNKKWRKIYGKKHKYSRDVELLLRFSAVDYYFKLENGEVQLNNYNNSYPKLLNDFSDESLNFDKETINFYKNNIEIFIDRIDVHERIPNLLLESLYFASGYIEGNYKIKSDLAKSILEDDIYIQNTLNSSSGKSKVKGRLEYVYNRLSKYVKGNKQ